jgi:hypothetical protein
MNANEIYSRFLPDGLLEPAAVDLLPLNENPGQVVQADTGLGTTYERWALNRLLVDLHQRLGFESVLEAPSDGMTGISGINSLVLGRRGVNVTLQLPDPQKIHFARKVWEHHAPEAAVTFLNSEKEPRLPFEDGQFELVWNFNVMPRVPEPGVLIQEMMRVSRQRLLVCVPNKSNYAFWLHRLHHRVARDPWDHGRLHWMSPGPWINLLSSRGLQVQEVHWLDCPWWPDIVDPGQMLQDFFPFMRKLAEKARPGNRLRWNYRELPYYDTETHSELHRQMERLAFFENTPLKWLKQRFAHHVCILASKGPDRV